MIESRDGLLEVRLSQDLLAVVEEEAAREEVEQTSLADPVHIM